MLRVSLIITILLLATLNQGCTPYNAPIVDLDQPPSQLINTHLVEEGESLYSIAWRYDFNVSELAAINGISKPYRVRKGQILYLDKSFKVKKQSFVSKQKVKEVTPKVVDRTSSVAKKSPSIQLPNKISAKTSLAATYQRKIIEGYNPKELRKGIVIQAFSGLQ